jgi:hypothetical protein
MTVHKTQPTSPRIFQNVYLEIIHKKCIKVLLLFVRIEFLKVVLQDLVKLLVLRFDMVTAQHLLLSNMSIDEPIETQHWLLTLFLPEALTPEEIHPARLKQVILKGSM